MSFWHRHPGVRSGDQLTLGERAADQMRNSMGSWAFVFGALLFLAVWMGFNGSHGFDPYPFILLNLCLSCLAALQGAILLIAAKRADSISSELAQHDYNTNLEAKAMIEELHAQVALVRADLAKLVPPQVSNGTYTLNQMRQEIGEPPLDGGSDERTP